MRKIFVVVLVLFILTLVSLSVSAYSIDRVLSQGIGLKGLLYADWQMDYYLPLNPDDLGRGDYRLSANMGRVAIDAQNALIINDYNEHFNNYFLALDTGITDNLSMRLSYDYAPFRDDSDYEMDNQVYSAYFNYSMKNDKSLYFGYNRLKYDFEDKKDPLDDQNMAVDYYFIGFEKRGSFFSKNN